jgi:ABC-2 type transport system ATP-binding protein
VLVSTDSLSKRFPSVLALDSLSIEVPSGVVGLLGPNGAGKSTLFKILLGLLQPSAGSARLLEHDVSSPAEIRSLVGYMPEHDCLPGDVTAVDIVGHFAEVSGLPPKAARERTAEALRHVGLLEERHREVGTYSTGMKQRAKLAQAIVHDPPALVLDEPTNGLDPSGRLEMLDLISRTGSELGISIIMSSHLLDDVERVCDYVVLIDSGRLVQAGPIAEFLAETAFLTVETDGGEAQLAAVLLQNGLAARADGAQVLVELTGEDVYDRTLAAIVDLQLPLIRLERRRRSLVELFGSGLEETGV